MPTSSTRAHRHLQGLPYGWSGEAVGFDDGMDPVTVLTDVIAAVQWDNGERLQRGEWTVAEEHAATAMAVAVSCSRLGSLPATRRFIEASTAAGVPIVVAEQADLL